MNKRAQVTEVSIKWRCPNGNVESQTFDGGSAEALLNSDRGVTEILAPFYRKTERYLKTDDLIAAFGPGVTALTGNREQVHITPQLVKELWGFKNEEGLLLPFVLKIPGCPLGFPTLRSGISFPQTANPRPQVTGTTLRLLYPNGSTGSVSLREGSFEGLFWSEQTVMDILAPFYNTVERRLSRSEMIDLCSPRVTSLIGNQEDILLTPTLVEELWNLEAENGWLPPFIMKIPGCPLEIPQLKAGIEYISLRKAA
jgi:hypothetical protein